MKVYQLSTSGMLQEYSKQLKEAEGRDHLTTLRDVAFELAAPGAELRRQRESFKVPLVIRPLSPLNARRCLSCLQSACAQSCGVKCMVQQLPEHLRP